MKCDSCKKDEIWLEMIGSNLICHKCINKHKVMGVILRTHIDTFRWLLKKLGIKDYNGFAQITRKDVESLADLKKIGVKFKTTNVVELE